MRTVLRAPFAFAALLCAVAAACHGGGAVGDAGEDCYPNGTCNSGLACQSGRCVATGGSSTSTGNSGGSGGAGSTSTGNTGGTGAGSGATSSSAGTGGAGTSSTGTTTTTSGSGASAGNSPPVIVTLGSNVTSITQGASVTITAIVTDPDGIDDVIGGNLGDGAGATYGAFATSSQEGSYELVISWDQIQQVQSIDFAEGTTQPRTFVATFYDQAAHMVAKSLTITLGCMGHGACMGVCKNMSGDTQSCGTCGNVCGTGASCVQSACVCPGAQMECNGVCKNLQTDAANCGTCGNACAAGNTCDKGKCGVLAACSTGHTSCNQVCTSLGKTCGNDCAGVNGMPYEGGLFYYSPTCSTSGGAPTNLACDSMFSAVYAAKCCCL